MKLSQIIKVASEAYNKHEPDLIVRASKGEDVGDTLATFIAIELRETFDKSDSPQERIQTAARTMESAVNQLADVADTLSDMAMTKAAKRLEKEKKRK